MSNNTVNPLPPLNQGRGVLLADPDGRCTHIDSGWVGLTGADSRQSLGDGWLDAVHPQDREWLRARWIACVRARAEMSVQLRLQTPDGQVRFAVLAVSPIPAADASGFVVTLTGSGPPDNQEEILQSRKMEAVGRLASGLAHDFANLLTLISGYSEIVLSRLAVNDPLRMDVDEIKSAANRGSGLTRQLLEFSRRRPVEPQAIDLNALVADMQKMLGRMIGEQIELSTVLSADLGRVMADRGQLEQVVMNLAINARDAMPLGGRISIRTANFDLDAGHERAERGLEAGPYVMLKVEDTGHGMDDDTLSHLFEPFFTTKTSGKGTGLGLATIYGIVKQGRGDVWADSRPAQGTTFTVLLPRVDAAPAAAPDKPARAAGFGTETILLVEDEEGVRRLLHHILGKQGYTVLEAGNGYEALEVFERNQDRVDLLLTDIVMPRMSGRELADRLLKRVPRLKIIFISGYTDEAVLGTGGLNPGALFLQKPLRPEVLSARVREMLDSSPTLAATQSS